MSGPTKTFPLKLDVFAEPVSVEPGNEIRLNGSYLSADGAVIDAATTSWPANHPGGSSVDSGGLVDLKGGGFHLTSRDPVTHEVVAVATGGPAPACDAAGVKAPCLSLRTVHMAQSRFMTREEFRESLQGRITVEMVAPPVPIPPPAYAPVQDFVTSPWFAGGLGVVGVAALCGLAWTMQRRRKLSPEGRMTELARRVSRKLKGADAALAATLAPVVKKTLAAVGEKRVDPESKEGARVRQVLLRVEQRLDETVEQARAAKEEEAADELVIEMESALEAASEAWNVARPPARPGDVS